MAVKQRPQRTFGISRRTIYNWLETENPFASKKPGPKGPRQIAYDVLEKHVADFPDKTLAERAEHFGVSKGCISYTLKKLTIPRKKTLTYKQQCPEKRQAYLEALACEVQGAGKTPAYVDECGFPSSELRRYGYAPRRICVSDKISGSPRYTSTSLIAARIGETFTAPVLFQGRTDALAFTAWLEHQLCPLLDETHVVILDNASFHKGSETVRLISQRVRVYYSYPRILQS